MARAERSLTERAQQVVRGVVPDLHRRLGRDPYQVEVVWCASAVLRFEGLPREQARAVALEAVGWYERQT